MYIVDSSVWIALFLDDDTQHLKAADVIGSIGDATIHIPYGVILETSTVLVRKQSKALANKFVEYIRDNPRITVSMSFASEDMRIFLHEPDQLAFVDAMLKESALQTGYALVSFDKKLLSSLKQTKNRSH